MVGVGFGCDVCFELGGLGCGMIVIVGECVGCGVGEVEEGWV